MEYLFRKKAVHSCGCWNVFFRIAKIKLGGVGVILFCWLCFLFLKVVLVIGRFDEVGIFHFAKTGNMDVWLWKIN